MGKEAENQVKEGSSEWLLQALTPVLRPVIRLITGLINFNQFVDLCRVLFIEESVRKLEKSEERITLSKISLSSGIDSRTINALGVFSKKERKLKKVKYKEVKTQEVQSLMPEHSLIVDWVTNYKFFDKKTKKSMALPIHGRPGTATFEGLMVKYFPRGITVNSVIERFVESGNIEISKDEQFVTLIKPYYTPVSGDRGRLLKFGLESIDGLLKTVVHNIELGSEEGRLFQRRAYTIRVPLRDLAGLKVKAHQFMEKQYAEMMRFLDKYDQKYKGYTKKHIGIGHYYFENL